MPAVGFSGEMGLTVLACRSLNLTSKSNAKSKKTSVLDFTIYIAVIILVKIIDAKSTCSKVI